MPLVSTSILHAQAHCTNSQAARKQDDIDTQRIVFVGGEMQA